MKLKKRVTATALVAVVLTVGAGTSANASPQDAIVPTSKTSPAAASSTSFGDEDVIAFLTLGMGEIVKANPRLATYVPSVDETVPQSAVDHIVDQYLGASSDFHEDVTVPLQSGNPREVQGAIANFVEATNAVAKANGISTDVTDPGDATGDCAVWLAAALAVAAAIAGAAVLVVNVNAVFNVSYSVNVTTASSTGLTNQQFAADLTRILGE